jgi:hypothetical protein
MAVYNKYTVWLLGAGFSRALGGPLLDDLFRKRMWGDDEQVFPATEYPSLGWDLYLSRLFCEVGKEEGRWQNAEDFLAFVDAAHRNSTRPGKGILQLIGGRTGDKTRFLGRLRETDLYTQASNRFLSSPTPLRRALAAECSAFLMGLDGDEEIWQPYRTWASTLDPGRDTVISFNYDLVLEKLAAENGSKLKVMMPNECPQVASDKTEMPQDVVPVLKLHGSVDWKKNAAGEIVRDDLKKILADEDVPPFIAAPGRSKQDAVKELGPLWVQAERALERAWALEILGYGFPATDTMARTKIQTAFSAGNGPSGEAVRRIDVVLGPDTNRPEAKRVQALLDTFGRHKKRVVAPERVTEGDYDVIYLKTHHLWAQDFIFDYKQRTEEPKRRRQGELPTS